MSVPHRVYTLKMGVNDMAKGMERVIGRVFVIAVAIVLLAQINASLATQILDVVKQIILLIGGGTAVTIAIKIVFKR